MVRAAWLDNNYTRWSSGVSIWKLKQLNLSKTELKNVSLVLSGPIWSILQTRACFSKVTFETTRPWAWTAIKQPYEGAESTGCHKAKRYTMALNSPVGFTDVCAKKHLRGRLFSQQRGHLSAPRKQQLSSPAVTALCWITFWASLNNLLLLDDKTSQNHKNKQ